VSFQATKWAMDLGLSLALGAVLKSLAHHASPDGSDARPGIERISWESGLAPRAVQNNLKQLETQGYIRKVSSGVGGRRQRTDYQLLMAENPAPDAPFTKQKPRISRQQTPHLTTLNPASHDITIRKNSQRTVIEQSYTAELPKKVVTKKGVAPTWKPSGWYIVIFNARKNWIVASPREFVERMEKSYAADVLLREAHKAADWIESKPSKQRDHGLKKFFGGWMERWQNSAAGDKTPRKPGVLRRPDGDKTIGTITRSQVKI